MRIFAYLDGAKPALHVNGKKLILDSQEFFRLEQDMAFIRGQLAGMYDAWHSSVKLYKENRDAKLD